MDKARTKGAVFRQSSRRRGEAKDCNAGFCPIAIQSLLSQGAIDAPRQVQQGWANSSVNTSISKKSPMATARFPA